MLYASLVMENLCEVSSPHDVSADLAKGLPTGIEEACVTVSLVFPTCPFLTGSRYEEMFEKLKKKLGSWKWNVVLRIFGWLSYAKRPLKLHEIHAATSINVNTDGAGDEIDESLRVCRPVEEICGSLVRIIGRERVEFSHSTAKK